MSTTVELVQLVADGTLIAEKRTNDDGRMTFRQKAVTIGDWQLRFVGKLKGCHPDRLVCQSSRSKEKTVNVT